MKEIKMGVKGEPTPVSRIDNVQKTGLVVNRINLDGSNNENSSLEQTINYNGQEKTKGVPIEIDRAKLLHLISVCANDLSTPRKLIVSKQEKEIVFIKEYNKSYKLIEFNYSIEEVNKILGIDEKDLSDFFTSFFIVNLQKYVELEYKGRPENIPIFTTTITQERKNTIVIDLL